MMWHYFAFCCVLCLILVQLSIILASEWLEILILAALCLACCYTETEPTLVMEFVE